VNPIEFDKALLNQLTNNKYISYNGCGDTKSNKNCTTINYTINRISLLLAIKPRVAKKSLDKPNRTTTRI